MGIERHMRCPACRSTELDHPPSKEDTIRYCLSCKFMWSTELSDSFLILMAIAHTNEGKVKLEAGPKNIQDEGHWEASVEPEGLEDLPIE